MALALDGYFVLQRIGQNPAAFPDLRAEVGKAAHALVLKQIKAKSAGVGTLRAIRKALGDDTFALLVDGLADSQAKSLVTKFDKNNAGMKSASAEVRRRHLCALADGSQSPAEKPARAKSSGKKSKRATPPPPPERLASEAVRARRQRD